MRRSTLTILLTLALVGAACGGGSDGTEASDPAGETVGGATSTASIVEPVSSPGTGACDPVDPTACLLPWPNDRFTRPDPTTETGRRIDLPAHGTPVNADGPRSASTSGTATTASAPRPSP